MGITLHINAGDRKYFPTFAELVDRLQILQLKEIFIAETSADHRAERALVEHDLQIMLKARQAALGEGLSARAVHAISVMMLCNHFIWTNEALARAGGDDQDRRLKLTHSVNGVRNTAKNVLSEEFGERFDRKIDCFAEKLIAEFGNWDVFNANRG